MKLGTTFSNWVAQPIARGIDGVLGTDLEHCTGCKSRPYFSERALNNLGDYITSWVTNKQGDKMAEETNEKVEYLLQVSVMAVDLREAVSTIQGGKIVSAGPMPKMGTIQPGARPIPRIGAGQPSVAQATSGGPVNKGG